MGFGVDGDDLLPFPGCRQPGNRFDLFSRLIQENVGIALDGILATIPRPRRRPGDGVALSRLEVGTLGAGRG